MDCSTCGKPATKFDLSRPAPGDRHVGLGHQVEAIPRGPQVRKVKHGR